MLKKSGIKFVVIVFSVVVAGVFAYLMSGNGSVENSKDSLVANLSLPMADINEVMNTASLDSVDFQKTYTNTKYNFSFKHPEGLRVSQFQEGLVGDTILAQSDNVSFQIFIAPFDEPGLVTPERIKQDLPDLVVEQPQQVIITKNDIVGLIFLSDESSLGKTREVWFVKNGFLYQITTLLEQEAFVAKILEGVSFQ